MKSNNIILAFPSLSELLHMLLYTFKDVFLNSENDLGKKWESILKSKEFILNCQNIFFNCFQFLFCHQMSDSSMKIFSPSTFFCRVHSIMWLEDINF